MFKSIFAGAAMTIVMMAMTTVAATAQTQSGTSVSGDAEANKPDYSCIPAIKIVIDLGYCFGFSESYYEAIEDQDTLALIQSSNIEHNISRAHDQCYPTDFNDQKILGQLAFSSYLNLKDDSLLRQSADHCNLLMDYYARQNKAPASQDAEAISE